MNTDTFSILISVFVAGYGVYGLYSAFVMKRTGIPPGSLLRQEMVMEARDLDGYCRAIFKPYLIFCILLVICGIISLINIFLVPTMAMNILSFAGLAVNLIWFAVYNNRLFNNYVK